MRLACCEDWVMIYVLGSFITHLLEKLARWMNGYPEHSGRGSMKS